MVKKKLSLVEPTLRTDEGFEYEEGEGLDDDEVAGNKAKLPIMLDQQSGQCSCHIRTCDVHKCTLPGTAATCTEVVTWQQRRDWSHA